MKEHKKLDQKQVSKVTLHFVWGHLSRKQTVQKADQNVKTGSFLLGVGGWVSEVVEFLVC